MTSVPTLAFIHTVAGLIPTFKGLADELLPGWSSFNIVDESLLQATIREGRLSKRTMQRLNQYVTSASDVGADAVVVTCSSLGDGVENVRPLASIPLFRIDQGMALDAVRQSRRIGVLATLRTTLEPTTLLLQRVGAERGKEVVISQALCEGAFDLLKSGDRAGHNASIVATFQRLAVEVDIIVLAQASMAEALENIAGEVPDVPFLASPRLGMLHVSRELSDQ
ncbi:MAG: hypothetical protein JWQ22_107 [Devosia sp.]|nr:hypothetical protein [Devosia sp.]